MTQSLFVFCKKCQENIPIEVDQQELETSNSGIVTVMSVHGMPQHGILVYVDKNCRVRAIEYPSSLEIEKTTTTVIESTRTRIRDEQLTFPSLVDLFGKKRKQAVQVFSKIVTQILMGGTVYIVHDNLVMASTVAERLKGFFSEDASIHTATHETTTQLESTDCIYSIQMDKLISKGNTASTKTIEKLVTESLKDESSFFKFKLDISKIIFSYSKVKEILSQSGKILDTELARMALIEIDIVPFLLELAKGEGLDISEVQYNGLGRIARGF